ncbi:unnamed protein product [Leptidea sinapis]|uniref:Enhancer of mRNA-decapping protein 4 C-terminal domain-containing protein n=1 Tax=Leptidea sinapis TaxID=189913 RepID=A0A5E4R8G0_9NEOP|nr:unnamed protein product [Leptidea sinapis]
MDTREVIKVTAATCVMNTRGHPPSPLSSINWKTYTCNLRKPGKPSRYICVKQLVSSDSPFFFNSVNRATRMLKDTIKRHQNLLESLTPEVNCDALQESCQKVLKQELVSWRQELLGVLITQALPKPEFRTKLDCQGQAGLSKTGDSKHPLENSDVNSSFEKVLSLSDLSVVMTACRSADPDVIFYPCLLQQSVLLSLLQQLTTDMVHDTLLKCRYIEEAIINLNKMDPTTRLHLPLVVNEVQKNLFKFLNSYPNHVASKRIHFIITAATNLLEIKNKTSC